MTTAKKRPAHWSMNDKRDMQGVTATLREQKTKETFTVVRSGLVDAAMREIADACDSLDGDWRVLCCSTPNTIWRDMQRRRVIRNQTGIDGSMPSFPERDMLGKIGRADLLDESFA